MCDFCVGSCVLEGLPDRPSCVPGEAGCSLLGLGEIPVSTSGLLGLLTWKMGVVTTAMHPGYLKERTQLVLNKHL